MDDLKVLSETDLFSTMLKSDYSSVIEENSSLKYLTKTYFNNSKQLKKSISNIFLKNNSLINIHQMLKTQNTNAPWLFNILKKKFHRSKKYQNDSKSLVEELLEKPINNNQTSGIWIINEKEIVSKNFDSSSTSPSISDSLHHYHYDFQTTISSSTPDLINHQLDTEHKKSTSIASVIKTYYATNRQEIEMSCTSSLPFPSALEDIHLISTNLTTQTKSASAARSRRVRAISTSSRKRGKGRSESTKKKKSKYYQEHLLTPEEIELREALRIIDLDNIGFFPPNELHKVLKELGIHSNDIEKIKQCLPLDEDGHYSTDNLIKLFLGRK